ncbi:MAG TPA: DUF4349 domain-containing protein, partial [Solirubrobacteraceae bacterium]|nr:DUF4349 domain-containing protein [Solirubrobacteraceae bacterium]
MRLRDPGPPLDPVAADELAALEAILLGEPVGVEHESLRELTLLVKESAPRMPAAFRLELDERVDAGFPASSGRSGNGHRSRRHRGGRVRARLGRWSERWPGRWVTRWPLAAGATFVVVAAVVAAAGVLGTGSGGPAQTPAVLQNPAPTATTQSLPYTAKPAVAPSTAPPIATARRQPLEAPAGASRAGAPTRATPAASPGSTATTPAPPSAASSPSAPSSPTARRVQRAASLTLATPTDSVANVADQVIGVTDRSGGIVRSSQVSSGDSSAAQATFDLSIPTSRLDAALAELSHLAHVRSRQQTSLDITDPYDAARASLNQALAQRQFLLRQL